MITMTAPPAALASRMMPRIANMLKKAAPAISARNTQRASSSSAARWRIDSGVARAAIATVRPRKTAVPQSQPMTARSVAPGWPGTSAATAKPDRDAINRRGRARMWRSMRAGRGARGSAEPQPRASPSRGISIAGQRSITTLRPCRLGAGGGRGVDDAELHPHHLGADRDRLVDRGAGEFAAAEDVDHVDRLAESRRGRA